MKITKATFITSVADENNFYHTDKPIIAIAGKSNVGKSSLINMLANNSKLARTSVTPGRTRLINYFDFGDFVLADLPGYGFAKVSKQEKDKWGKLLESFFQNEKIVLLVSLVDIRHDPTIEDIQLTQYLYHYMIPFSIVATKADKLGKSKIKPALSNIARVLKVGVADIKASSSETGLGKEDILGMIAKAIAVSKEKYIEEDEQED